VDVIPLRIEHCYYVLILFIPRFTEVSRIRAVSRSDGEPYPDQKVGLIQIRWWTYAWTHPEHIPEVPASSVL